MCIRDRLSSVLDPVAESVAVSGGSDELGELEYMLSPVTPKLFTFSTKTWFLYCTALTLPCPPRESNPVDNIKFLAVAELTPSASIVCWSFAGFNAN